MHIISKENNQRKQDKGPNLEIFSFLEDEQEKISETDIQLFHRGRC